MQKKVWSWRPLRSTEVAFVQVLRQHGDWVRSNGWYNKTRLESLALICSELGEAFDELDSQTYETPLSGSPKATRFLEELIDCVLRLLSFADEHGIEMLSEFAVLLGEQALSPEISSNELARLALNQSNYSETRAPIVLLKTLSHLSRAMNDCRKSTPAESLRTNIASAMLQHLAYIAATGGDADAILQAKMAKNALNGTRGRLV